MARIKITKQVNQGDSVGVSASGINGYTFRNWTENGSVVSSSNPYNFTAQSSRLINATFNAPVVIVASSSDSDYGSVSGSGTYSYGSTVNVSATANSGYEFGGWTESGSVVSNSPSYSFTATSDRNLVATFNSVITVRTTGADTIYLYNKSNQTYTWNLSSGTNTYDGSVSGFELDNLKYVYKFTNSSGSDNLITYVDISKTSIEDISNYAFCSCSALTTFIFPDTLTTIGSGAFTNSGLTTFTIPSSVKFVNNNSFYYSTWWNNYAGGTIYYKDNVCLGCDTSGTRPTGSVSITSGTRVIATDAFTICTGITSMSLPNSLKVINNSAFYYCSGLHSLTIPTSVEYIGVSILDNSGIYSDAADHTTLVVSNCVVGHKGSITGDVELPNTTRLLSAQSFAFQTGITSFKLDKATPPIYCNYALDTANNPGDGSCTSPIYVPSANVNDYKTADGWTAVASRIQSMVYYTISATASPNAGGSVSGTGSYLVGSTCTLTATAANSNYVFVNWTENGVEVSTNSTYSFTVSGNRTLVANFGQTYMIYSQQYSHGTATGYGRYPAGATCTMTATPDTGYEFVSWKHDSTVISYDNPYSFTVSEEYYLGPEFNLISYTISASASPNGGGTISGSGSKNYGTTCTLVATAASGYSFVNWTENGTEVSTNASYSFTVNSARTLVANFELQTITISASPNTSSYGTVSGNSGTYSYGDTVSLTATAKTGYKFVNWTENGTSVSTSSTYTFTATQNRTLVANFQVIQYTISAEVRPVSTYGTVSGTGTKNYGSTASLRATPNTGYKFSNWRENGSQVSTNNPYSFTVNRDRSLWAVFTANTYTISASVSPSGSGTVSGAGTKSYGTTCTLVATANSGYEFVNWTQNGSEVSTDASYSFTVSGARTLVANFQQIIPITITTTGSTTVYLKNNSDQTYTWNLTSGTNTYSGNVSGFELSNLKSIYKYTSTPSDSDFLITSIDISGTSITNISERSAWGACKSLTSVIFPETITTFGREAFWNCEALANITFPASVSSIGKDSFSGCSGLSYIRFKGSTVPTFLSNSFSNTNNCTIYVPSDAVDTYKAYSSIADRVQAWPY